MDGIRLFDILNLKAARLFTIFSRRAFGSFGRGSLLYFPNYLTNPARMFIGANVRIMPRCWIMAISEWEGKSYGGKIFIGDDSLVSFDVQISANSTIRLGKGVAIGRGSVIADHIHNYRGPKQSILNETLTNGEPITIEDGVFIGVNCVISPGVHIGRSTFIGANSVVVDDLPPQSMAAGNPARVISRYDSKSHQWNKC